MSYVIDADRSPNSHAATALADKMIDISGDYYCAGWMHDLEFDLWSMLHGGPREYGMGEVSQAEIDQLLSLHEACGGWIVWQDGDEYSGERFVSTEDWQRMVAEMVKS